MASPPNTAHLGLNPPQKRPTLALPANPTKRRKPSSGPSHLRQTSFPPENNNAMVSTPASVSATTPRAYSRSPSVESSIAGTATNSLVNGVGGRKKRKGKKDIGDDARSQTGTSVRGGKGGEAAEAEAEEDEDMGEDVEVNLEGGKVIDDAAAKQDRERLALLMASLDDDQRARYAIWRAVKLKKEIVRRITNQTLSQSVPQSVILTINGYTKTFIGELIDRARQVQLEWHIAALDQPYPTRLIPQLNPPPRSNPPYSAHPSSPYSANNFQNAPVNSANNNGVRAVPSPYASPTPTQPPQTTNAQSQSNSSAPGPGQQQPPASQAQSTSQSQPSQPQPQSSTQPSQSQPQSQAKTNDTSSPASTSSPVQAPALKKDQTCADLMGDELGPLTPDHLREALRRYKKDREGNATGFLGLSLEGRENSAAKLGGRRLFR